MIADELNGVLCERLAGSRIAQGAQFGLALGVIGRGEVGVDVSRVTAQCANPRVCWADRRAGPRSAPAPPARGALPPRSPARPPVSSCWSGCRAGALRECRG